jgi:hypothetical protein
MAAVELDRQAIERRDFPIGRRGYDTAAVDAHLRALAAQVEELQRAAVTGGADISFATTAGSQVQGILAAAGTAAAEIERHAVEAARQVREAADRDADSTREQAIAKASAHVGAVARVAATLLERVGSLDSEVNGLIEGLRAGGGRLAADLAALEENMGELYDAASGQTVTRAVAGEGAQPSVVAPEPRTPHLSQPHSTQPDADAGTGAQAAPVAPVAPARPAPADARPAAAGDLDGARLIALNMALNGESRSDTERYLAENFQLPDRTKLIDEVYAAIEG